MGNIFCFLIVLFILLTAGCSENGKNVQEFLLTSENVHIYIDQQKKIVDSEQENAPAHYNLARSYYFIKEYEKAEYHARKATRYDPLNAGYYELLGSLTFALER